MKIGVLLKKRTALSALTITSMEKLSHNLHSGGSAKDETKSKFVCKQSITRIITCSW